MGAKKEIKASIFLSRPLFNFIITLGCLVWGQRKKKQPPDYLWQLLKSASRPKADAGGGRGDENGRKSALIMFLYQGEDLAQDGDSVLWTSCSSDGSCGPPSPRSMSVSFCIHPILCHRLNLRPIQDASYFHWLGSYTRKCPNRAWHPHGQNTTFHLNYSIDFPTVYCRFFLFFPFIFLFVFPGSLCAAWNTG